MIVPRRPLKLPEDFFDIDAETQELLDSAKVLDDPGPRFEHTPEDRTLLEEWARARGWKLRPDKDDADSAK